MSERVVRKAACGHDSVPQTNPETGEKIEALAVGELWVVFCPQCDEWVDRPDLGPVRFGAKYHALLDQAFHS